MNTDTPQSSGEITPLNYRVVDREGLQNWIMRKLGHPLVTIELTTDQLNDSIDDAMEQFAKYCKQDEDYYIVDLKKEYVEGVGVKLPSIVQSIADVHEDYYAGFGINTLFTVGNQMMNAGMAPFPLGSSQGWASYEMYLEYLSLSRRMLGGPHYVFSYSPVSNIMKLFPDPKVEAKAKQNIEEDTQKMCVVCNVIRPNDQLYGEQWTKRMALAKSKETLGRVRTKFDGIQLLGGGTVDTSVLDEGKEEQVSLMEELRAEYVVNSFCIG